MRPLRRERTAAGSASDTKRGFAPSLIARIGAPHWRRRDKRVELLGGYPGRDPEVSVVRFEPVLGEAERRTNITDGVTRLGAESFDEATGDPLDNFVDAQRDEWEHRLNQQYMGYQPQAEHSLGQAIAAVAQYQRLHEEDLARLQNAEIALETAVLALSGTEPGPAGGPQASGSGRPAGRPAPEPQAPPAGPPAAISALELTSGAGSVPGPRARHRTEGGSGPEAGTGPGPRNGAIRGYARPRASDPARLASWSAGVTALAPPKLSRAELRQLVAPSDASRVPRWGEPGFRDGALLAGRPRGTYLHALALLLAAGADIGAFTQVVELVLPQQSDPVVWLVVAGLTSVVLYIAHSVGMMLREARACQGGARGPLSAAGVWAGRRFAAFGCTVAWTALGLMAYWVRLKVPPIQAAQLGAGSTIGGGLGAGPAASAPPEHVMQAAVLFLGLYVATGIVAAVGAYFTHNPYRGRYDAAIRAYRKASERTAASAYQLVRAQAACERQQAEMTAAPEILAEAHSQNRAFTEQLKQTVRIHIAGLAKDPAVTDAILGPGRGPHWPNQHGPRPGEN
jgi:hypothetical protein